MEKHFALTNADFEQQFTTCQLDPAIFSHEAHLRLTWIHLDKYGLEQAKENIQNQLQQFVRHLGAEDKYNERLTIAAVQVVYQFMQESETTNFQDFIDQFPQLKSDFRTLINTIPNPL